MKPSESSLLGLLGDQIKRTATGIARGTSRRDS